MFDIAIIRTSRTAEGKMIISDVREFICCTRDDVLLTLPGKSINLRTKEIEIL